MTRIIVLSLIIAAVGLLAIPADISDARTVAENQLAIHSHCDRLGARNRTIQRITPIRDDGAALCYIAELEPAGYIAISSDTDIRPIIAFSYSNDFDFSDSHNNIAKRMLLQDMRLRREAVEFTSREIIEDNNSLWREFTQSDSLFAMPSLTTVVGPFLDTHWNQSAPYNNLCPIDPETGDRCVVGCTATSMAQVINYWEYPSSVHFTAEDSYESDSTSPPIWIDATTATMDTIDYNGVGDQPDAANKAGISWACGVSVWAIYGSEGTIAWFHDSSFTNKWGYVRAEKVDPPDWPEFFDTLQANMMTARPAQLGIFYYDPPDTSGHAIVCDGWMDSGEYHLNYGWGGFTDGWYALPEGIPAPFDIIRWAIVNIEPPHRPDGPDMCAEAMEIVVDDGQGIHSDELSSGDQDWFVFDATDEYTYVFSTSGLTDSYGELYADCGGEPFMSDNDGGAGSNFNMTFFPESTGTYYLRVSQFSETVPFLYNLRYYRANPPSVSVTLPSGGETINDGSSQVITWTREGTPDIPAVSIEYSIHGADGPWESIEDSIANSGLYIWAIPDMDTTSHDCYVRIAEYGLRRISDTNDSPFTIVDVSNIAETAKPEDFALSAYPNPFNSSVMIFVGEGLVPSRIEIYDVNGRKILQSPPAPLIKGGVERSETGGSYKWTPDDNIGSGIYLVRARFQDGNVATKRVVYLK